MLQKSVSFQKALRFSLTGSECYRTLKVSVSYVVFNINTPFFSLIYPRSILKSVSREKWWQERWHSQHSVINETLQTTPLS